MEKRDCSEEANDEGEEHDQGGHSLSPGYFKVKRRIENDRPGDDGTLRSVLLLVLPTFRSLFILPNHHHLQWNVWSEEAK